MELKWTPKHGLFIDAFLSKLEENRIKYFVLRNYEGLPEHNPGKDVDVVIEPGCYKLVNIILLDIMRFCKISYYTISKFDNMHCWYNMDYEKQFGLHIDIIENEVYKGYEFYVFDYLYSHTIEYKKYKVLDKTMDTVMLLVQNLVAYRSLKDKYKLTVIENYQLNKADIDNELLHFWGDKAGRFVIKCLETNDFTNLIKESDWLAQIATRRIFKKSPFKTIWRKLFFIKDRFYRIVICPRKLWRFIAVEAPDGTGKTTFIENMIKELCILYVRDCDRFVVRHFRPTIFPNLGAVGEKAGLGLQDKNFTNPHRANPAGFMSSFIRIVYYWLDYVIGIPLLLRNDVHYEKYTIFDRYVYDFLIDPKRSRISLPYWIRKIFVRFVIQPQIVFVLDAQVDTIFMRKQELSKEEIERQLNEFRKLVGMGKQFVEIDANKKPEEVCKQAIPIIIDSFMTKVE